MKKSYRFKVYRDYAKDHVVLSESSNTMTGAISTLRKKMKRLDGRTPTTNSFELLSVNPLNVSLKKKYKTRDGKRVELHSISESNETFPVKGIIITCEKPRRIKYAIWTAHGESRALEYPHSNDLI